MIRQVEGMAAFGVGVMRGRRRNAAWFAKGLGIIAINARKSVGGQWHSGVEIRDVVLRRIGEVSRYMTGAPLTANAGCLVK